MPDPGYANDPLQDFWFGEGRGAAQRALQQGQQYSYIGASPYQAQQSALLSQLMEGAMGRGPSVAGMQYQKAAADNMASNVAMSRGRGPGAARQAMRMNQRTGAQLGAGSALAAAQERQGAQSLFQNALTAANQADFQRAAANQAMYQQAMSNMQQQGGMGQSIAALAAQGIAAFAGA